MKGNDNNRNISITSRSDKYDTEMKKLSLGRGGIGDQSLNDDDEMNHTGRVNQE